ncbi:fibronectin type III domain-containing protein [Mesonia sp.]|nr:fibronectin type III domain-containing protein [Mesonia sp.]
MRKTTYYLIAFLISSCLWQINAQTTHNLDWSMGISSADASLTIDAGDTVIWTFTDTAPHSVTSDTGSNETFDSGTLGAGSTYQYTFTEEGVNDYHCEVHPSMVGTITVNAAAVEDQVQIGDGTNESQHTPFEPYYWYSYTQSIYLSSEINASGNITSLQWYYSGTSALEDNQDLTIYLGETTKSSFSSSQDWEDVANLTQVYNGGITVTAGTPGWVTITFDTPFEYTGEGNLMVAVDENDDQYDNGTDDFHNFDTGSQRSIGFYSDSTNPDPNSPPTSGYNFFASNFVPNIIFGGIAQTCPAPTDIVFSDVTSTSAEVDWTAGSDETEWELLYGETGFDPETEGTSVIDDDGVLGESLTDLSSDTEYELYIKSICSVSDESAYVGPFNFTTLVSCPDPMEIYTSNVTPTSAEVYWMAGLDETEWELLYGETGFDPETEGMTVNDNDGTLGVELTDLTPQMQYDVYVKAVCGVDDESTWVGPYTFGDYNALEVTGGFNEDVIANGVGEASTTTTNLVDNDSYAYLSVDYQSSPSEDPAGFGLPLDGNLSEGPIDGLNFQMADYSSNNALRMDTAGESNGGTLTFDNSQTASNLYIMATSGSGSSVLAGTITFEDNSTQDFSGIDVPDWYGGPANMTIISGLGRVNVTNGSAASNSSNPRIYQLEVNIDPSNYDKVISSVDLYKESGSGVINVFGASIQFAPDCAEPTDVLAENITSDSADITWTEGNTETQWEVLYGEVGFDPETEGTTVSDDDGVLGVTLSDLDMDTTYEVYVKSICGEGSSSIWTGPVSFSTPYCVTNFPSGVEPITLVDFGDIENVTSASTDEDAQEYFLDMTTDLGQTYSYTITAEGNTNGPYTNLFTVFFDWNQDGEFNNEDERFEIGSIYNSTGEDGQQASAVITVPEDALVGETRMRVTKRYYTSVADACNTSGFGQAEDYTVNVVEVSCFNPSELVIENITTTTADVSWTSNGDETEWEIIYGAVGFDPETEGNTIVDNDELGETISDLTPEMEYDVYIKAVCGVDDESQWVGPESFMTPPTCPKPINLMVESLTFTSADVSWEAGDLEDEWFVIYGEAGFDPETDGETVYVTGTPEETLTSLTPETDYEFYVVAICSVLDTSSLEGPVAFTTDYCESMPSSNDGTGFTTLELQSTVFASGGDITYEDFTDTPVEVTQGMMVSFEVDLNTGFGYDYNYNVWVDFNDNLEFEESELVVSGETEGNSNEVFDASFILPEDTMIGNHRLRLAVADSGQSTPNPCYNGSYGNTADFTINVIEPCEAPTEVDIDNVTDSTAEVTWMDNAGVTEWEVLYGETGFDPASEGESVIDNNEELGVILSDLTPETTYDVYVRAICNETTTSEWTVVEMFTTLQEPCEAPTEVDIDNVTDSTAEVTWMDNAGVTEWEVLYGETGFDPTSEGESMMDNDGVLGVVLSDLTPETTYDVYVRAICDTDNMSEWTVVEMFTTLQEPCEAPTEVDIDNVTNSTAEVTWMDNAGVNEWEVLYGETGFDPLTEGESMMDNDGVLGVTLIGLDAETTYDVYVRAICDTDNMSEWTAVESFTTDFLGVNTENFVGFNYYPNPVKNSINLESRLNIDKVSIYNLLGQEVLSRDLNEMSPSLDMSNLASGAYILRVQIGSQSKIIRVIKE